jgi:type IV pilus assembly protein PilW
VNAPVHGLPPRRQTGFTLVELLVALVLGLLVVGAVLSLYLGNVRATRTAAALAQLNDDGQAALALIGHELRQAGYNPPPPAADAARDLGTGGMMLLACDGGFAQIRVDLPELACRASEGPAALAVVYLGDGYNTVRTASTDEATDCVGSGIRASVDAQGRYFVVQNRLFVERGSLMCAGSGGVKPFTNPQPFVENVDDLQVVFGVGAAGDGSGPAAGYLRASEIGPASDGPAGPAPEVAPSLRALAPAERWARVRSVQVCVLVRSATPVVEPWDPGPAFRNCAGQIQTSSDGRLRQTFRMTVQLRNQGPA